MARRKEREREQQVCLTADFILRGGGGASICIASSSLGPLFSWLTDGVGLLRRRPRQRLCIHKRIYLIP